MNSSYKRQYRELPQETKDKISAANRNRPKSTAHKQHISQAMTKYWASVPSRLPSGITEDDSPSLVRGSRGQKVPPQRIKSDNLNKQ